MATNLNNFDSLGGFSVGETTHIDKDHNAMSLNSIEMKNLFYNQLTQILLVLHLKL